TQQDTSHSRRYSGLGLGLALVKQLVEMHGGEIGATSAGEGQGATFTVTLPAMAERGSGEWGVGSGERGEGSEQGFHSPTPHSPTPHAPAPTPPLFRSRAWAC